MSKRIIVAGLLLGLVMNLFTFSFADTYQGYKTVNVIVNGQQINGDTPAIIFNGRTLVPVRFVSDGLGADVQWDSISNSVLITNKAESSLQEIDAISIKKYERITLINEIAREYVSILNLGNTLLETSGNMSVLRDGIINFNDYSYRSKCYGYFEDRSSWLTKQVAQSRDLITRGTAAGFDMTAMSNILADYTYGANIYSNCFAMTDQFYYFQTNDNHQRILEADKRAYEAIGSASLDAYEQFLTFSYMIDNM